MLGIASVRKGAAANHVAAIPSVVSIPIAPATGPATACPTGFAAVETNQSYAVTRDRRSGGMCRWSVVSQTALKNVPPLPPQSFLQDLLDGWREFTARTWVWSNLAFIGVGNTMFNWFFVLGAAVAKRSLGGAGAWGLIVGALGLGAVAGGILALRIRPRRPLIVANLGLTLFAVPTVLLAFHLPALVVAAGAVVGGSGGTFFNAIWETTLQRHILPERLSRVTAYDWFVSTAANPVGQAVAGPTAGAIGIEPTLGIAATWFLAAPFLVLAIPSVRHLRDGANP